MTRAKDDCNIDRHTTDTRQTHAHPHTYTHTHTEKETRPWIGKIADLHKNVNPVPHRHTDSQAKKFNLANIMYDFTRITYAVLKKNLI